MIIMQGQFRFIEEASQEKKSLSKYANQLIANDNLQNPSTQPAYSPLARVAAISKIIADQGILSSLPRSGFAEKP